MAFKRETKMTNFSINLHQIKQVDCTLQPITGDNCYYLLALELTDISGHIDTINIFSSIKPTLEEVDFTVEGYEQ